MRRIIYKNGKKIQVNYRNISYVTKTGFKTSFESVFLFPGQGAQFLGMSGELCARLPSAMSLFKQASDILGYDLLEYCVKGPKSILDSTLISQPAIFVSSMAALEKLKTDDPNAIQQATVAMGLSLGEYSALCFAGAFTFEDGVRLTKARGEAMQKASDSVPSGMTAIIGLERSKVEDICNEARQMTTSTSCSSSNDKGVVSIGNYLAAKYYSISGSIESLEAAKILCKKEGLKDRMIVDLPVAGAFHTELMLPALKPFQLTLDSVNFLTPRIPVLSNIDAQPCFEPEAIRASLALQVTSPVQWETIMTEMVKSGQVQHCYEVGPGSVCKGILKRFDKNIQVTSVSV